MKKHKLRPYICGCVVLLMLVGVVLYCIPKDSNSVASVMENIYFADEEDPTDFQLVTRDNVNAKIDINWLEEVPSDVRKAVDELDESLKAWSFTLSINTDDNITDKDAYVIVRAPQGYAVGMLGLLCGYKDGVLEQLEQKYYDFHGFIQYVRIPYSTIAQYDQFCFVQHDHIPEGGDTVEP